jgi:hypothetical protein
MSVSKAIQCISCGNYYSEGLPHECKRIEVAKQPHYTQFKIQPIEFIVANKLNYNQGNIIKYVCRFNSKDGLKDLEKAKVYLDYLIQEVKTGEVKP